MKTNILLPPNTYLTIFGEEGRMYYSLSFPRKEGRKLSSTSIKRFGIIKRNGKYRVTDCIPIKKLSYDNILKAYYEVKKNTMVKARRAKISILLDEVQQLTLDF